MKRCQRCNVDFPDDLRFCTSCGSALAETAPSTAKPSQANVMVRETFIRCPICKDFIRTDARLCEHCGASLVEDIVASPSSRPEPAPTQDIRLQDWYVAPEPFQQPGDVPAPSFRREVPPTRVAELTSPIRNEKTAPVLSGFEAYGASNTAPSSIRSWRGAILLLFFLIFAGGLGVGGWWWWSSRDSAAQSPAQPNPSPSRSASPTQGSMTTSDNQSANGSADDELKKLRERRISARPADGNKIVTDLEDAEKRYPKDYRFPYERAKLSIKGVISHHEAFEALFLAAEKAIDNGKAQEMLNDLIGDKDGDFYKMSRGHHEWATLEGALRNKDKSALKTNH